MISNTTALVVSLKPTSIRSFFIVLKAPGVAKRVAPGQFVYIKPKAGTETLLRRAFSVMDADPKHGLLHLYIDIKGPGTQALARLNPGDELAILGPLGNGFPRKTYKVDNVLVGGGCGSAPLYFLAKELKARGKKVHFYYGARNKQQLPFAKMLAPICDKLVLVTDDGSQGKKGVVTRFLDLPSGCAVFSCGPKPMLRALASVAPEAYIAMETEMACGLGVCMGCAVPMNDGSYKRCCKEGPVFKAGDVAWN